MPRAKGTPKTGGRAKGTPNKTTADLKKWVLSFVADNLPMFKSKFKKLPVDEQFAIILKLLPYVLPKQSEGKLSIDENLTKSLKDSMEKINDIFQ